jgi:hypothetical protein
MTDESDDKHTTLDGKRLSLAELNMGIGSGAGKFKRFLGNLSEFLAGMYTGESCAGTPHGERKSKSESSKSGESDS